MERELIKIIQEFFRVWKQGVGDDQMSLDG